jgi:hypothetical protein
MIDVQRRDFESPALAGTPHQVKQDHGIDAAAQCNDDPCTGLYMRVDAGIKARLQRVISR